MPEFLVKPRALTGELYTPGQPCAGVFPQDDGRAVVITWRGPLSVEVGACIYPDPEHAGYFLMKTAEQVEPPQLRQLKAEMTALWEELPVEVRAAFRPLKTAVLDAINDGCIDEVQMMVASADVPAEYQGVKDGLLSLIPQL